MPMSMMPAAADGEVVMEIPSPGDGGGFRRQVADCDGQCIGFGKIAARVAFDASNGRVGTVSSLIFSYLECRYVRT